MNRICIVTERINKFSAMFNLFIENSWRRKILNILNVVYRKCKPTCLMHIRINQPQNPHFCSEKKVKPLIGSRVGGTLSAILWGNPMSLLYQIHNKYGHHWVSKWSPGVWNGSIRVGYTIRISLSTWWIMGANTSSWFWSMPGSSVCCTLLWCPQ